MPEKATMQRARADARRGRSASTQAGEFVREEMHHIREGKHGARSTKQAIAIGLSKARRAGVPLQAPRRGSASSQTRRKAEHDLARGKAGTRSPSRRRSRATSRALRREGHQAATRRSLGSQARSSARRRGHRNLSAAARKGARTRRKGRA
jgi:uncharacterized protein DUF6496